MESLVISNEENGQQMSTQTSWTELDDQVVAYARALAADAVQKVGNGHPGTAMLIRSRFERRSPT